VVADPRANFLLAVQNRLVSPAVVVQVLHIRPVGGVDVQRVVQHLDNIAPVDDFCVGEDLFSTQQTPRRVVHPISSRQNKKGPATEKSSVAGPVALCSNASASALNDFLFFDLQNDDLSVFGLYKRFRFSACIDRLFNRLFILLR
jgi:hypothetical protein